MSAGGSKLKWCTLFMTLTSHTAAVQPFLSCSFGSYGSNHRALHRHGPRRAWTLTASFQIALGVIIAWGRTIHGQFELLAGKSAPHDFIQLIIYKAMVFSDDIEKIDTVRAYHVSIALSLALQLERANLTIYALPPLVLPRAEWTGMF